MFLRKSGLPGHFTEKRILSFCSLPGPRYPCTMIRRTANWVSPNDYISGIVLGLLYLNRISGFLNHKPGETFLLGVLATLLSPLV